MKDITKRTFLKTGLVLFSGSAALTPCGSLAATRPALFSILCAHRWLTADPAITLENSVVPPIAVQMAGSKQAPLIFWARTNLELIKKYRINPLRAARTLSYLMVTLHDVHGLCIEKYGSAPAQCATAMHLAAGTVVEHFFPEEIKGRWIGAGILFASQHATRTTPDWADLWRLSQQVAQRTIAHALTDGSARINAMAQPPGNIHLAWKAAPPLWSTRPAEPGASTWRPWLVPSAVGDRCPPPLTLDEARYAKEIQKVHHTHQHLTPQQRKIADDWNLELGTVSPPGVWLLKAIEKPAFLDLAPIEQTAALSLLTAAMFDAFIACWYVKFTWWTERPVTAIRRLHDPGFLPHVLTPSFPSYPSGHATVSGAAASLLSNFFPQHQEEWMQAAQEASDSRLYGGIHFSFDNEEGLSLGKKVGALAISAIMKNT
ncbi:MAG: vanadium-dependent haloperoxidase [Pseudomonadota bacterium]